MSWTNDFYDANFHVVLFSDEFCAQVKSSHDGHLRQSTDTLGTLPFSTECIVMRKVYTDVDGIKWLYFDLSS